MEGNGLLMRLPGVGGDGEMEGAGEGVAWWYHQEGELGLWLSSRAVNVKGAGVAAGRVLCRAGVLQGG